MFIFDQYFSEDTMKTIGVGISLSKDFEQRYVAEYYIFPLLISKKASRKWQIMKLQMKYLRA